MMEKNLKPDYVKSTKVDTFEELVLENRNNIFRILSGWLLTVLIILFLVFLNEKFENEKLQEKVNFLKTELELKNDTTENDFSKEISGVALIELIEQMNLQNQKIIVAQAIIESGHFKSDLFKSNNNLFGMRKAYQRPTTHVPINIEVKFKNYAYYYSWEYSVYDYALWQTAYARNLTENEYLEVLKKTYAEDENYVKKIKSIIYGCETTYDIISKYKL